VQTRCQWILSTGKTSRSLVQLRVADATAINTSKGGDIRTYFRSHCARQLLPTIYPILHRLIMNTAARIQAVNALSNACKDAIKSDTEVVKAVEKSKASHAIVYACIERLAALDKVDISSGRLFNTYTLNLFSGDIENKFISLEWVNALQLKSNTLLVDRTEAELEQVAIRKKARQFIVRFIAFL
jgi:hypothetical protein